MDAAAYSNHVAVLEEELVCALGCTEPIAVALAAALARDALGAQPEALCVTCSGNIIKNVRSVTVPNSGGMHGIEAAAILGMVGGDASRALEVLVDVNDTHRALTRELMEGGLCAVELAEGVPNLYIRIEAAAAGHTASVTLAERHTNVVELSLDGVPVEVDGVVATDGGGDSGVAPRADRAALTLGGIWDFAATLSVADVTDIVDRQLELNEAIANQGMGGDWGARIGMTLLSTRPNDVSCRARALAAAGSDARMSGCALPVVINSGSGNQGITCSMPPLVYARELGSGHDRLVRAVVISNLVSVHVKHYIGELSAFCGAVSAAAGAGAGICYLRGGTYAQYEATVVNTLANVGGIVCDGAKPSCAAKIAAAVDAAILACDQALAGVSFAAGDGLVADDAEATVRSMGYVGRVGMHPTDVEILNIMLGKTDPDGM